MGVSEELNEIPQEKCLEQYLARSKHSVSAGIIGRSKGMGAPPTPRPHPARPAAHPGAHGADRAPAA